MGIGMGFSMMPLMSGAMQTLRKAGGRACLDDAEHHPAGRCLDRHRNDVRDPHRGELQDRFAGKGGRPAPRRRGGAKSLPLLPIANRMAEAYGATYWWALALIVPAILCALLLPRVKPEPFEDPSVDEPSTPAPVLVH